MLWDICVTRYYRAPYSRDLQLEHAGHGHLHAEATLWRCGGDHPVEHFFDHVRHEGGPGHRSWQLRHHQVEREISSWGKFCSCTKATG